MVPSMPPGRAIRRKRPTQHRRLFPPKSAAATFPFRSPVGFFSPLVRYVPRPKSADFTDGGPIRNTPAFFSSRFFAQTIFPCCLGKKMGRAGWYLLPRYRLGSPPAFRRAFISYSFTASLIEGGSQSLLTQLLSANRSRPLSNF